MNRSLAVMALLIGALGGAHAAQSASPSYAITADVLDAGGGPSAGAPPVSIAEVASFAGAATSRSYRVDAGYVPRLVPPAIRAPTVAVMVGGVSLSFLAITDSDASIQQVSIRLLRGGVRRPFPALPIIGGIDLTGTPGEVTAALATLRYVSVPGVTLDLLTVTTIDGQGAYRIAIVQLVAPPPGLTPVPLGAGNG